MISPKTRYLIFFQYFGTKYSGVMKAPPDQEVLGVQNYLEKAAEKLRPATPIKFIISSRTDSGVHALCNAAHVDIERASGKLPFTEDVLRMALNRHLKPEPIHILGVRQVPSTFHARFSALSRTYVYRAATGCSHPSELPVFERDLCWATCRGHLNLSAMQEAATYLMGTHNFSAFRSTSSEIPTKSPVRTVIRAEVRLASGVLSHHCEDRAVFPNYIGRDPLVGCNLIFGGSSKSDGKISKLRFWELEFKSRSFLYKQVRRMVGALVAVGQNRMEPQHVKKLLEAGDMVVCPQNMVAPASGLFLKNVEYCEDDLVFADLETGRTEKE